jgi:hypothetical protein
MPSKQLGIFLNSTAGFWAVCAGLAVLLFAGRFVLRRFIGKDYQGQAMVILTLALVSVVFLALTIWFPVRGEVSAAVVPRLWIAGILACLVYLIVKILNKTESPDEVAGDLSLPIKFILATLGYIVLMVLVGYFIASVIFLAVTMTLLSYRRRLVILAISCGWMVFSYVVFYRVLFVPLPQGLLINALFG